MIEEEKNLEIFAEENVVLCLWNYWIDGPLESFKNELTFSLYNITKFNLLGHHDVIDGGNYIEDKDIDVCIDKAYATKRKYAIISVPGHHMNYKTVWELVAYAESNPKAGLIAHLIDDAAPSRRPSSWFGIHPQLFLINLHIWDKIRKPKFGMPRTLKQATMVPKITRSTENIHDDYTPMWYKPTGRALMKPKGSQFYWAWNIINEILFHDYECQNIPIEARQSKKFYYADTITTKDEVAEVNELASSTISLYFQGFMNTPFLFNTEYYKDLPLKHIKKTFENFIILPSGFKGHWLIEQLGYTGQEKIFFYDINISSIYLRKYMIETWDGNNFIDWLNTSIKNTSGEKLLNLDYDLEWYNECWQNEIKLWNGHNNFMSHWKKLQKHQEKIIYLFWDIEYDTQKTKQVNQLIDGKTYMWISNIYNTGQLHNKYDSINLIEEMFNKFISTLSPHIETYGDTPVGKTKWIV